MNDSPGIDKRAYVKELKADGKSVNEIVEITGLKKPTVYSYLRADSAKPGKRGRPAGQVAIPTENGGTLSVTPTKGGKFLVTVPADKLAKVAQALAS